MPTISEVKQATQVKIMVIITRAGQITICPKSQNQEGET